MTGHGPGCCCPYHRAEVGASGRGWWWLLAAVSVVGGAALGTRYGLDVSAILTVVVVTPPAVAVSGWVAVQVIGEWQLQRMCDRPRVRPVERPALSTAQRALPVARPRLAIEAARPAVVVFPAATIEGVQR